MVNQEYYYDIFFLRLTFEGVKEFDWEWRMVLIQEGCFNVDGMIRIIGLRFLAVKKYLN